MAWDGSPFLSIRARISLRSSLFINAGPACFGGFQKKCYGKPLYGALLGKKTDFRREKPACREPVSFEDRVLPRCSGRGRGDDEESPILKIPPQGRGPSAISPPSAALLAFRSSITRKSSFLRRTMENREHLPDPLFMKKLQEFCIKQGGVGSKSGLNSCPVWEF